MSVGRVQHTGRVLVIEDEARIAALVARGLRAEGMDAVMAEDGDVGLFLATTDAFDLVVLDLGLPARSGLEVLRDLRSARPDLPVVMLTGHDEPQARQDCLRAGAAGFVTKPFSLSELRMAVRAQLA